jgi:ABC-type uncharacterized transport system ATPase subunit
MRGISYKEENDKLLISNWTVSFPNQEQNNVMKVINNITLKEHIFIFPHEMEYMYALIRY